MFPVDLMNTLWADRHGVHDSLATPEQADAWLRTLDLPAVSTVSAVSAESAADLRALRDALRRLAAEATADTRPDAQSTLETRAAALDVLNGFAAAAPTWSGLEWADAPIRTTNSTGTPGQALLALIAEQAIELFSSEQVNDLRACLAPGCVQYFVKDHPRREWCSAGCGNRARVARHYNRHHQSD